GLAEPLGELMDDAAEHRPLLLRLFSEQRIERLPRVINQFAGDVEPLHRRGWQLELELAKNAFAHGHQAAGAGPFLGREFRDAAQTVLPKEHFDAIGAEGLLDLPNDAAFGRLQDLVKVINTQRMAHHPHGEPPDELRFEAELDEIAGL